MIWSDSPLIRPSSDQLGRSALAFGVADLIRKSTEKSVVFGLLGPWGAGKSSFINFVTFYLEDEEDLAVVRFNPWFVGEDEQQMVFEFLTQLVEELDGAARTKSVLQRLAESRYLRVATKFGGNAGDAVEGLADVVAQSFAKSIGDYRVALHDLLEDKRVLVVVDDIDRLSRSQLTTVFRMLKVVADFDRVHYLIAFDPEVIRKQLQGEFDADVFIEKIVQVPIELPAARSTDLSEMLLELLNTVLDGLDGDKWSVAYQRDLDSLLDFARSQIRTPRAAMRFGQAIALTVPLVAGEVDLVDFLKIEAIRLLSPSVYESFRVNARQLELFVERQADTDQLRNFVEDCLPTADRFRINDVVALLATLYGGKRSKRISRPEFFQNYFAFSPGQISLRDIERWFAGSPSVEAAGTAMADLLSQDALRDPFFKRAEEAVSAGCKSEKTLAVLADAHDRIEDVDVQDGLSRLVGALLDEQSWNALPNISPRLTLRSLHRVDMDRAPEGVMETIAPLLVAELGPVLPDSGWGYVNFRLYEMAVTLDGTLVETITSLIESDQEQLDSLLHQADGVAPALVGAAVDLDRLLAAAEELPDALKEEHADTLGVLRSSTVAEAQDDPSTST